MGSTGTHWASSSVLHACTMDALSYSNASNSLSSPEEQPQQLDSRSTCASALTTTCT